MVTITYVYCGFAKVVLVVLSVSILNRRVRIRSQRVAAYPRGEMGFLGVHLGVVSPSTSRAARAPFSRINVSIYDQSDGH